MHNFSAKVAHLFSIESESGVTAIEYGLIAALVAVAIIAGITLLGGNLNTLFTGVAGKVVIPGGGG
jgi:pilus assembly protein Flp/PilA